MPRHKWDNPVQAGGLEVELGNLEYLKTLPSYAWGSLRQTLATLEKREEFSPRPPRPLLLVPGAFCTGSVMNRLGRRLQSMGLSVGVAPDFPYYFSALANLCRLEQAVGVYRRWLERLRVEQGIERADVAGHSNGGLIALLELATRPAELEDRLPGIERVVTMAAPFGGFPAARLLAPALPCCRDIHSGAAVLRLARAAASRLVVAHLVSGADSLIPAGNQYIDREMATVMDGFQHMDFIVGSPDRVEATAREVVRWLQWQR